jgi:hypothetical protein
MEDASKGGFLRGDNGLLVTVLENAPSTRAVTAPTTLQVQTYNWEYTPTTDMPYGRPINRECISVGVVLDEQSPSEAKGYFLNQNYPNPFASETRIEFNLPYPQEARLIFCDALGKVLHTVEGDYGAGKNAVAIRRESLPATQGGVLFYRLETATYTSNVLKMTLVDL